MVLFHFSLVDPRGEARGTPGTISIIFMQFWGGEGNRPNNSFSRSPLRLATPWEFPDPPLHLQYNINLSSRINLPKNTLKCDDDVEDAQVLCFVPATFSFLGRRGET